MLKQLKISNFKCLGAFDQPLGSLTLLTGMNASGKSSVIQALTLLKQTVDDNEWGTSLLLNGSAAQLGTMFDVIDRNTGGSGFSIGMAGQAWTALWKVKSIDRLRDLVGTIDLIELSAGDYQTSWTETDQRPVRHMVPFSVDEPKVFQEVREILTSVCHVGAERVGPRDAYLAQSPLTIPDVGSSGEKTPWCLEQFADSAINPSLKIEGVAPLVRLTVEAWMGRLFPGFKLDINRVNAANLVTMGIRTTPRGDFFRPGNVGFGLTHVLPIVVAGVSAMPSRLLLVESPESHLHPAGQSLIGFFLAKAAAAGVQVLVETHSDHVLNGVRRAIRDGVLRSDQTRCYFFGIKSESDGQPASVVATVEIDQRGRIANWPEGFFDQFEFDMDYIFR